MRTDTAHIQVCRVRPLQHGTVVLTPWVFTENNLECDSCLVNLPTTVVAFLTVNLGWSEEGRGQTVLLKDTPTTSEVE